MASVINIMEVLWARKQIALDSGLSLSDEESTKMQQRFRMLCGRREKVHVPLFLTLLAVMVVIYLGSYMVILEADYEPAGVVIQNTMPTTEEFYAISNEDGIYTIFCGDVLIEYTDTLDYYPSDILVYNN